MDLLGPELIRAGCCSQSSDQLHCMLWMEKYFVTYGDHIPNSDREIRLGSTNKSLIYHSYAQSCESKKKNIVQYNTFVKIWKNLFPNVTLRSYVNL